MEQPPIQLTDEDRAAARELLQLHPDLGQEEWPKDAETWFAEMHHAWGRDNFQVRLGLRAPATLAEECSLAMFRGEMTEEQSREKLRAWANRPIDARMLEEFYADCGRQIARYGRFMHEVREVCLRSNRHPITDADEELLDRLAREMKARSPLYKEEILTAIAFAQETRIELKLGPAQFGEFSALSVGELFVAVELRAQVSWGRCCGVAQRDRELAYAPRRVRAVQLFWEAGYSALPTGGDLRMMLEQEFAHARVYLRQRQAVLAPNASPADDPQPEPSEEKHVLLSVERWSDLAIGIDEHWRYWALAPRPELGAFFKKTQAIELVLPGDRWKVVLELLARSETGDVASRADLVHGLGYLPFGTDVERDRRARPGAVEAANVEGLEFRQMAALTRLTKTLGDLRRELDKVVDGPGERHRICLRTDDKLIRSGFVVRFLVPDESGRLKFGHRT